MNLRQPCSSLRSPQSSSKSQTKSEETHRSFLQRNSVGEQVATKTNSSTVFTRDPLLFRACYWGKARSYGHAHSLPVTSCSVCKINSAWLFSYLPYSWREFVFMGQNITQGINERIHEKKLSTQKGM